MALHLERIAVFDAANVEADDPYLVNAFVANNASLPYAGYALAHELTHILTNAGHGGGSLKWRLMLEGAVDLVGPTGSRRLSSDEASTIQQNSLHAH